MVTAGILPFRENSHGRTGNRTRDLMISSQRLRPLDHEAGNFLSKFVFLIGGISSGRGKEEPKRIVKGQNPSFNMLKLLKQHGAYYLL